MPQHNNEHFPVELSPQLVSIMTTEHYNLQAGRSLTTAETNGRSSLFVGAVSSGLIALTFVGQIAHLGTAFFVFSTTVVSMVREEEKEKRKKRTDESGSALII